MLPVPIYRLRFFSDLHPKPCRLLFPACFHPTLTGLRRDLFIVNFIKLSKQVSMSTRALKNDVVSVQFVNEQPVWFNMAFTTADVIPYERMIETSIIKPLALN